MVAVEFLDLPSFEYLSQSGFEFWHRSFLVYHGIQCLLVLFDIKYEAAVNGTYMQMSLTSMRDRQWKCWIGADSLDESQQTEAEFQENRSLTSWVSNSGIILYPVLPYNIKSRVLS